MKKLKIKKMNENGAIFENKLKEARHRFLNTFEFVKENIVDGL